LLHKTFPPNPADASAGGAGGIAVVEWPEICVRAGQTEKWPFRSSIQARSGRTDRSGSGTFFHDFRKRTENWQDVESARQDVLASLAPGRITRVLVDESGIAPGLTDRIFCCECEAAA
jgi:hypothetical protein